MSQYLETNKIKVIADAGTSLATAIETKEIKLDNYQSAKIVIKSSEGEETTTTAKVIALLPDKTEKELNNFEAVVGGKEFELNVVANQLAHYDATSFKIKVDAISESSLTCEIIAILGEPRYAVEE